jgi:hypothetical protein
LFVLTARQAIILCLDLSESMDNLSGVSHATVGGGDPEEFDHEKASFSLLNKLVEEVSKNVILEKGETRFLVTGQEPGLTRRRSAKGYLRKQHPSCHQAWRFYLQSNSRKEGSFDTIECKLLKDLGTMARRDALNLSFTLEADRGNLQIKNTMLEVRRPVSRFECHIYNILDVVRTFCSCMCSALKGFS